MQSDKYVTDTFNFDPLSNSFKYLVSNTLYTESEINTLRPLLVEATPIVNPVTGKYESSFVYNNPNGYQYLYLVWDLTNAYSIDLCYDATDRVAACELCGEVPHYSIELCYDSTNEVAACELCNPSSNCFEYDIYASETDLLDSKNSELIYTYINCNNQTAEYKINDYGNWQNVFCAQSVSAITYLANDDTMKSATNSTATATETSC
jgi:hypothetical protein